MSDLRNDLQATFQNEKRYANYGEAILSIYIKGFRNHVDTKIQCESPVTAICGVNGTGKSTVLQLAASAYQEVVAGQRFYISSFILAGNLDTRPFTADARMEIEYAQPPAADGKHPVRTLSISRSGSSWSGYDSQPKRSVVYLGLHFYLHHSERDEKSKALFSDSLLLVRSKKNLEDRIVVAVSRILLCKYDSAHQNTARKKWGRSSIFMLTAKRGLGAEYSEANMGSGEVRVYLIVSKLETVPEKSLVLIEEPETSLHPSAQYELGRYLMDVAKRRGLQILLTTHSEYLLLALPQMSRVYLKRDGAGVVPIPRIGVRQAISLMDNCEVPSLHILVEDDVGEAIVSSLLRRHDPEFHKTVRFLQTGDKSRVQSMLAVFEDQQLPVCGVRDGDFGADKNLKMFKLFGSEAPEREIFKTPTVRECFCTQHKVDWDAVELENRARDHHEWFKVLEKQTARKREELLPLVATAYLDGVPENERQTLVQLIKSAIP